MFWKVLGALVAVAAAVALAIAIWPQAFGLELAPGVAQVVSLRMGMAAVALVLAALLGLVAIARALRPFALTLVALLALFAVASTLISATRGFGGGEAAASGPDTVTVLAWNTLGD